MITIAKTMLRPVAPEDAALIARYCADEALARMTGSIPHPYGLREAEAFCASAQKPECRVWAVEDENGLIGTAGYRSEGAVADIGYWIAAPFAGRGHATRSARLVIERAFSEPQIERLTACVFQDNPASAQVLRKAGMIQRADCEGESVARGPGTYPTWTFALFREDWEAQR